jgi:hypothetical protein
MTGIGSTFIEPRQWEFDRDKLPASIDLAEKAIHQRLRGLPIAHSQRSRRAIREMAPLKRLQPVSQQSSRLSSCQSTCAGKVTRS